VLQQILYGICTGICTCCGDRCFPHLNVLRPHHVVHRPRTSTGSRLVQLTYLTTPSRIWRRSYVVQQSKMADRIHPSCPTHASPASRLQSNPCFQNSMGHQNHASQASDLMNFTSFMKSSIKLRMVRRTEPRQQEYPVRASVAHRSIACTAYTR
jgi:hypothetical protein